MTFFLRPDWAAAFPDKAGLWGDFFGFVNALLSALAFAGVLVTLWMQRRELQLQRLEMTRTRKELDVVVALRPRAARARCRVQDVLLRPRAVLSRFLTGERPTLRGGAQLVTPQESLASMQTHSVEWGNRAGSCVPDRYQMKLASWCSKMNAVLTSGI